MMFNPVFLFSALSYFLRQDEIPLNEPMKQFQPDHAKRERGRFFTINQKPKQDLP